MRKKVQVLILLAVTAPMLGGCNSLLSKLGLSGHRHTERLAAAPAAALAVDADIELGRQALAEGQYAAAIAAFRYARLNPANAAEASNGLGVAYAMLGRDDLAERYFREAVALGPQDARFAGNLAHFYKSRDIRTAATTLPAAPSAPPSRLRSGPVRVASGGGNHTVTVAYGARPDGVRIQPVPRGPAGTGMLTAFQVEEPVAGPAKVAVATGSAARPARRGADRP